MSISKKQIENARAGLVLDQPFFASILLPMPLVVRDDIQTLCTDGDTIWYNPEFMDTLTPEETMFALAHEVLHCVFDHMGRREHRTPNRWNQAADYIINDILVKENVGTFIKGCLLDPALVQKGNGTAEGVYKLLPEANESKQPGSKGGSFDQVHDAGSEMGTQPVDAATATKKQAEMRVKVIQARNAAKMQGALSANMDRLLGELVKPVIDWKSVLRRFVTERAKLDYSFARPKRRFLAEDFYLPSLTGEKMGVLTVAVDCSGSVDLKLLNKFASEINAIKQDTNPSRIDVVYFDSSVCHTESFEAEHDVSLAPKGGGGTAFSPVFRHINAQPEQPIAVIFLTDLICNDFGPAPEYPVLWAVLEGTIKGYDKVPFGDVLEITDDGKE